MSKPWSQLPNAHLIDWVIESLKNNPYMWRHEWAANWAAALNAARNSARNATWNEARNAAYDAAYNAALNAAYDAAWNAAWNAIQDASWDVTYGAARNAAYYVANVSILALVAYDDCDAYLNMSYDQLLVYALLSERPQAILLLPMKWVQENECMVTTA